MNALNPRCDCLHSKSLVEPVVLNWKLTIQTFLDKYNLTRPKKNDEFVDSKPEIVIHNDEISNVEEKLEVEVQDTKEQVTAEDTSAKYANVTHDALLEEPVLSIDECSITAPVCVQPPDEILGPVQSEIHPIFANIPNQDFVLISNIVDPVQPDEYYKVFPLPTPSQKTNGLYYKIVPMSNVYKITGLRHNLIMGGYSLWLVSSRFFQGC